MSTQAMQDRLLIRAGIERNMDEVARRARQLVEESKIFDRDLDKSQVSNVLQVSLESSSVEVVKNFVLYQMGRDTNSTSWSSLHATKDVPFGEALLSEIASLQAMARNLVQQKNLDESLVPEVWLDLVRQYLGQMYRCFVHFKRAHPREG